MTYLIKSIYICLDRKGCWQHTADDFCVYGGRLFLLDCMERYSAIPLKEYWK